MTPPEDHLGHRLRLRKRAMTNCLYGMEAHEVLEFLLTCVIPVRDMNPLAHRLIEAFGSLGSVLKADRSELLQVQGVGEKTAEFLCSYGQMVWDIICAPGGRAQYTRAVDVWKQIRTEAPPPGFYVVCLSEEYHWLRAVRLSVRSGKAPCDLPDREAHVHDLVSSIVRSVLDSNAYHVVVIHCGQEQLSGIDISIARALMELSADMEFFCSDVLLCTRNGEAHSLRATQLEESVHLQAEHDDAAGSIWPLPLGEWLDGWDAR